MKFKHRDFPRSYRTRPSRIYSGTDPRAGGPPPPGPDFDLIDLVRSESGPNRVKILGCRKWGFKRWGFKQIGGYLRKRAFFLRFLDFPGALRAFRKRGEKGRKRAKKADFGRFPEREARHPLNPPFVTPPFVAHQKSGPGGGVQRGVGCSGVGPVGVLVAPPASLYSSKI